MGVCCVDGCDSDDKEDVVYFPVPVAPALRRKWREAINPTEKLHQDSRICSKHFNSADYEKIRGKLRLKARVVPSVFDKRESASPIPSPAETNGAQNGADQDGGEKQNGGDEADENNVAMQVELSVPEFGLLTSPSRSEPGDTNACTIECVPELLHEESDSHSETELHKEDIEDIIANYHIQQHSKLNNSDTGKEGEDAGERGTDDSKEKPDTSESNQDTNNKQGLPPEKEKEKGKEKERDKKDGDGDDVIEIECDPAERRPEFIEISVDADREGRTGLPGTEPATDDCMIVLENVQVDIDPAALMLATQQDSEDESDSHRKGDPISLLTSSDEDDVIIEEPHIDTVEVSSETDEDDKPLVTLVKSKVKTKPTKLTRILWGNLTEYYCYQCKFTTLSKVESERHKLEHSNSKILHVCEVCNFTCASKSMFSRHKKRHKEEKRFKCKHCEYKARHSMSLIYHMKSHENITVDTIDVDDITINDVKDKFKCSDCKYVTRSRKDIEKHLKSCVKGQWKRSKVMHLCDLCTYSTNRKSDLRRHRERRHMDVDDECED